MMAATVRPTPGMAWMVAGMVFELAVDLPLEHVDLLVHDLDQITQRFDTDQIGPGQLQLVQPGGADHTPEVF
jgi:hypothetical protein